MGVDAPRAVIERLSPRSSRLARLRFRDPPARVWTWLYEHGQPIQYTHLDHPLALAEVQTRYASRPWAAEMPSAGRPLTAGLLLALRRRGVTLATLTHAAGLSALGAPELDALLPLPERDESPARTGERIATALGGDLLTHHLGGEIGGAARGEQGGGEQE